MWIDKTIQPNSTLRQLLQNLSGCSLFSILFVITAVAKGLVQWVFPVPPSHKQRIFSSHPIQAPFRLTYFCFIKRKANSSFRSVVKKLLVTTIRETSQFANAPFSWTSTLIPIIFNMDIFQFFGFPRPHHPPTKFLVETSPLFSEMICIFIVFLILYSKEQMFSTSIMMEVSPLPFHPHSFELESSPVSSQMETSPFAKESVAFEKILTTQSFWISNFF